MIFKAIVSIVLLVSFIPTSISQSDQTSFPTMGAERYEEVDVGGLHPIGVRYKFALKSDKFQLDTVFVKSDDLVGYDVRPGFFFKNQISAFEFEYNLSIHIVKRHLGYDMFSETLNFKGIIFIEGENKEDFSVVHELTEIPKISPEFLVLQYFWAVHIWLLIASAFVLLISKEPLNLRHGLIVAIPVVGSTIFLFLKLRRSINYKRRKKQILNAEQRV